MRARVSLCHAIAAITRTVRTTLLLVTVVLVSAASAQDYRYWDIDGPTPGAGGPTPSGTWSGITTNWSTSAAGDVTTEAWVSGATPGEGSHAFFSAGSDATGEFTVTIDGTNYGSGLTVNQGTVILSGSGFFGIGSGTVTIRPGATLGLTNQLRVTQTVGGLAVIDGGTLMQTNPGNAGSLWNANADGILLTSNGGTVNYSVGNNVTIYQGTFLGEGGTTFNGGAQTLTKTGTSELRVQGARTADYTIAKLKVLGGLYRIGSSTNTTGQLSKETGFGAIPYDLTPDAITLDGGAIGVSFTLTTDPFRGITLGSNGGVINTVAATMTVSGAITGPGALRAIGKGLTLAADNTYTGGTVIGSDLAMVGGITTATGGTMTIDADSRLGAIPAAPDPANVRLGTATAPGWLTVTADTTFDTHRGFEVGAAGGTLSSTRAIAIPGTLGGSGPFTKTGAGTLTLSGNNTITGGITSWGGGVLEVSSDANLGAVPGSLKANGVTLAGASTSGRMRTTQSFTIPATRGITINVGGTTATPLGGTIEVADGTTLTVAGPITGAGRLTKSGSGALVLAGTCDYAGTTTVGGGTLVVDGTLAGTGAVSLLGGATLAGHGTVAGATTISAFATLSPGSSPGTLAFGSSLTFADGGDYNWQMLSASGSAGSASSWDLVTVGGVLNIAATPADPFSINLWTLSSTNPDTSGEAAGFNPGQNYTWTIARTAGGITGFAADKFLIATSSTNGAGGFANDVAGGTFSLAVSGNDLNLVFTSASAPGGITIDVTSGTQTQTQAGYPTLSGSLPLEKTGGGTLVVDQANTLSGSTTIQGGVLQLANLQALQASRIVPVAGGTLALAPYQVTTVGGLDPSAGGLTDVGSGLVTVAGGLSAADLVTAIVTGYGDGSWNGTSGITSTSAAADAGVGVPRAVGWLDNGDGTVTFAYAAPGDTNLDWSIDLLDIGTYLAGAKYDTGEPSSWSEGDYTYDGLVDITDVALYLGTGLFDVGPYNPPAGLGGGVAAVPEPAGLGLLAAVTVAAAAARCRRR